MTKKVAIGPQERIINFVIDLLNSSQPIDYSRYLDEEEWGDERTFRRMRALVNQVWEFRNQTPLFEIVDDHGRPKQRGEGRFVKLVDKSLQTGRAERMAVMPSFMQMLQTLKGTILAEEFQPLYKSWYSHLSRKEKRHFDRTEKKFYCFSKGTKRYDLPGRSEALEEVYDALLKEQALRVEVSIKNEMVERVILPLSLVMFNTGLYLLAKFKDQETDKIYSFAIESFASALSIRGDHFEYPADFDPANQFEGDFGFFRSTSEPIKVTLEYDSKSWVSGYLRERRWTGNEAFKCVGTLEIFEMEVTDLREVTSWVLPLCDQCRIVGPKELKDAVKNKILAIADRNEIGLVTEAD